MTMNALPEQHLGNKAINGVRSLSELGSVTPSGAKIAPDISESELALWQDLIQQRSGHYFSQSRHRFLRQRLWERMCLLGINNYYDYYKFIVFNPKGAAEWLALQEQMLNTETSFFRHDPSFRALNEYVLPRLCSAKQKQQNKVITMWSAGCSTGQEAYSLAMTFFEAKAALPQCLDKGGWGDGRLKISASDICSRAIDKAKSGRYKAHELRFLSPYYLKQYMDVIEENGNTVYQVKKQIRSAVQYGYLHLHELENYWIQGQDIIFCQNVLIYFEQASRLDIVSRLCQCLNPGGYLFLGPAEIVGLDLDNIQLIRLKDVLVYQRKQ